MPSLVARALDKCEADDLYKTGDKGKTTQNAQIYIRYNLHYLPWLISNLMHKILIYLRVKHLL